MSPLEYQFDPSGSASANLIAEEVHSISVADGRAIVPNAGLFYTESVYMEMVANPGVELIRGVDYTLEGFDSVITAKTGLETASVLVFDINPALTGDVAVTYQAVGGVEGRQNGLALQVLAALELLANTGLDWDSIQNKPSSFPPESHLHSAITDLTGLEGLRASVDGIREALYTQRPFANTLRSVCDRVDFLAAIMTEHRKDINEVTIAAAGINPPNATELVAGLIEIADATEAVDPLNGSRAMTPLTTELVVEPVRTLAEGFAAAINQIGLDLATLQGEFTTLETDFGAVEATVASFTADVTANTAAIVTLSSDLATAQSNISTNASNIATNAGNISTNAGNISTNAGNISTLQGQMTAVQSATSTNTGNIATNAGNISTLQGQMSAALNWPAPIYLDWGTGALVAEGATTVPSGNMGANVASTINMAAIAHPLVPADNLSQYAFQMTPEVFAAGNWYDPGFGYNSNNNVRGVYTSYLRATSSIRVQSGEDGVSGSADRQGAAFTNTLAAAPVRIRIQLMNRLL